MSQADDDRERKLQFSKEVGIKIIQESANFFYEEPSSQFWGFVCPMVSVQMLNSAIMAKAVTDNT